MNKLIIGLALSTTVITGCTTTQRGAGIGAVLGAGAGAIIGHQSGNRGAGALIGAAVGGLGGAAVGNHVSEKRFCSKCGYTTTSDESFCPKDGNALKVKSK